MPGEQTLLRALITARHWQKFPAFEAQFKRAAQQLADECGEPDLKKVTVSARQFERWYAGRVKTAPHPDACRVLEHMFGYPVHALLGAVNATAQQPGPAVHEVSEFARISALGEPGKFGIASEGPLRQGSSEWDRTSSVSGCDNPLIFDPERMIAMAGRRAMRFGVSADASNVGPDALGLLRAEAGRLALAYPQQPLPSLISDIVTLQDDVFTLLEGRQRPGQARDLYVIGGLASGLLAKAAHDFSDPHMAMTHARTALLCAKNAEHSALAAWVYGLQSLITYWADRPRDALQYAQAGMDTPESQGTVRVWLASLEARAWSALGNIAESRRALENARRLRERVTGDDLDEFGGICQFSQARQLYYAADAGVLLPESHTETTGQETLSAQTESYALAAIAAYESAPAAEKSFGDEAGARTDLAIARIRAGNLDGAAEAVHPVLDLPADQRINGIVRSVVNVHRAITAKAPDAVSARELQEEIESYCRTPAAALPS